jgi:hypothetical protein
LGNVLFLDLFLMRARADSFANPTDDASRVCQLFSYDDCATANRNGLNLDGEPIFDAAMQLLDSNNDPPECAGGWRLSGCGNGT